jgi:hypothetical protein
MPIKDDSIWGGAIIIIIILKQNRCDVHTSFLTG